MKLREEPVRVDPNLMAEAKSYAEKIGAPNVGMVINDALQFLFTTVDQKIAEETVRRYAIFKLGPMPGTEIPGTEEQTEEDEKDPRTPEERLRALQAVASGEGDAAPGPVEALAAAPSEVPA